MTNWYIQRKTATSGADFGSLVSKTNFVGKSISAGGYFLISKYVMSNSDIVYDGLTLTESNTLQIKNGDGDVVDKIGWGDSSACDGVCAPNPTDGKSIQRTSSDSWITATHTPGYINTETEDSENTDNTSGTSESDSINITTSSSSSSKLNVPFVIKITTKIISPKTVISGIPFSLSSLTMTNTGETYAVGKFVWNFGDGMVKKVSKAEPFDYTYDYPGEYVVNLSYFDSLLNKTPDATDRMTIKIVPSEIYISSVGDNADPFIEIENKSNYEIVLSNWKVTAGVHYFIIPNGTSILPGKKIKLSPKITGFVGEDIKSVSINDPSNNVVATYPAQKIKTTSKSVIVTKPVSNNAVSPNVSLPEESQVINLNDLSAEAENSGANIPKSFYPFLGLIVVIGLGISSFLIIKTRNKENNLSDERIRAEDIAIIE